jgi:hypothetical protein
MERKDHQSYVVPLTYDEVHNLGDQEFSGLDSKIKIESAAESLFDYVRFKSAYGDSDNVIKLKQEFNYIINLLNDEEQNAAIESAYQKLNNIHFVK